MKRLKVVGLAVMAVLALSALVSATASAAIVVLPETAQTFTGSGGKGTLTALGGSEVRCESQTSEGTIEAKKPEGAFHITFKGCTGLSGFVTCTGLADSSGVILTLGTYKMVFDKLGAELGVGVLFKLEPVHFSCSFTLVEVSGEVLCLIKPLNVATTSHEIVCKQAGGDPSETVYWNAAGTEVKMGNNLLATSENHNAAKGSGEETTGTITTTAAMEIME